MTADRCYRLSSGRTCTLRARPLLGLRSYHVLFLASDPGAPSQREERELFVLAQRVAARLGQEYCGDPGCYVILFSGSRTRRRPWPHFHIVPVRNVADKRRALLLLYIKRSLILLQRLSAWLRASWRPRHV
ncbi:MAG TPA: hypothetical protein VJV78_47890 [Polyangiales bacterium]|nr:hypothetical protein [Polyangiales bacterium]